MFNCIFKDTVDACFKPCKDLFSFYSRLLKQLYFQYVQKDYHSFMDCDFVFKATHMLARNVLLNSHKYSLLRYARKISLLYENIFANVFFYRTISCVYLLTSCNKLKIKKQI